MARELLQKQRMAQNNSTDLLEGSPQYSESFLKIAEKIKYFWVFGSWIEDHIKVVYFELNRLYMKSKDYRSGYKVLKKLVDLMPTDIEVLSRFAKYCHFIGRNRESKKYYKIFKELNI